jgi:hypothetical protein
VRGRFRIRLAGRSRTETGLAPSREAFRARLFVRIGYHRPEGAPETDDSQDDVEARRAPAPRDEAALTGARNLRA